MSAETVRPIRGRLCVDVLREVLTKAERGELTGVVVVYQSEDIKTRDSAVEYQIGYGRGHWKSAIVGQLESAKLDILLDMRG